MNNPIGFNNGYPDPFNNWLYSETKKSAEVEPKKEWICICGNCLEEMEIEEWMDFSLFWKTYHRYEPMPHEDHPIPHLNRSHYCKSCNAQWELIENLGNGQDWIVDRFNDIIYLVGKPHFNMKVNL